MAAGEGAVRRRRGGRIAVVVAGVLVAAALGYFVVAPAVQRAILPGQLDREAGRAYAQISAGADADRQRATAQIAGVLGRQPVYSAVYDLCYTDHRDGGWIVLSYVHHCSVAYVDFFEVADGDRLQPPQDRRGRFWRLSGTDYPAALGAAAGDLPLYLGQHLAGDPGELIDAALLVRNVVAYASSDAFDQRKLIRQTEGVTLDPQRTYLVLTQQQDYFRKDIGCAYGTVLFCESPLGG